MKNNQPTGKPDPDAVLGIAIPNPEGLLQSYDARVVSNISERLKLESVAIPVAGNRHVLAIRVPNSLNKPHLVRYRAEYIYFPARRERHRYYMDAREIKEMVMRTASHIEQAEQKLKESFLLATQRNDPPLLIVGIIPVFFRDFSIDLRNPAVFNATAMFSLDTQPTRRAPEYSFVGLERRIGTGGSRVHVRRDGLTILAITLRFGQEGEGVHSISPPSIDLILRRFVQRAGLVYDAAGLGGPYLLSIMLRTRHPVRGIYFGDFPGDEQPGTTVEPMDYSFPMMQADTLLDIDQIIRPLCDQAHQTFGRDSSPQFDDQGRWIEPRRT